MIKEIIYVSFIRVIYLRAAALRICNPSTVSPRSVLYTERDRRRRRRDYIDASAVLGRVVWRRRR